MLKKTVFLCAVFLLLVPANLILVAAHVQREQKVAQIQKIIDEIDNAAKPQRERADPVSTIGYGTNVELVDGRVANLKNFFRRHNSPLFDYAEYIVEVADKYTFDYRLLPSIAMIESTLCKAIPSNSYNCWGWGIYGNTTTRFESYEDAIEQVSAGLRKNYLDRGLVTATQIMSKYTPSSNSWARNVNSVLSTLE